MIQAQEVEKLEPGTMRMVVRERLANTRRSITRKFTVPHDDGKLKIYVTVGMYTDGRPGELFIKADKTGTLLSGTFDAVAISMSIGLQYGVPMDAYTAKLIGMRFPPSGFTGDKKYPTANSVLDLIGRWLRDTFSAEKDVLQ